MKRKEMNNVSSFPFPYLFFLLQISFNFSILFVSSERQWLFLTFSFEILRGKFARAGQNRSPRACPTFDRCVIGASVRFQQRIVRDRNLFQEQTQPETYFNTSVLFNLMFFSCTYFYLFCLELFQRERVNLRERFTIAVQSEQAYDEIF